MLHQAKFLLHIDTELRPGVVNGARKRYIASRRSDAAGQVRCREVRPTVRDWPWQRIWTLARELEVPNKLRMFQFKVLHRILAASAKLQLWGLADSAECYLCGADIDNIEHTLVLCRWSQDIWKDIMRTFDSTEHIAVRWSADHLLFGFFDPSVPPQVRKRLNTIVLLAKQYIYSQRSSKSFTFSAIGFQFMLKRFLL